MFCKYCGKQIADDSVFCSYCGKTIASVSGNAQKILHTKPQAVCSYCGSSSIDRDGYCNICGMKNDFPAGIQKTSFIPAICPQCGSNLSVSENQKQVVCPSCGNTIFVDRAIKEYEVTIHNIHHKNNYSEIGPRQFDVERTRLKTDAQTELERIKAERELEELRIKSKKEKQEGITDTIMLIFALPIIGAIIMFMLYIASNR